MEDTVSVLNSTATASNKPFTIARLIADEYRSDDYTIDNLIDQEILDEGANINNTDGQVRIGASGYFVEPKLRKRAEFVNMTLSEYFRSSFGVEELEMTKSSYFVDCIFESLSGSDSSAISIYESRVIFSSLYKVGEVHHFKNNVSNKGSTVFLVSSTVLYRNITSIGNTAVRGGCI